MVSTVLPGVRVAVNPEPARAVASAAAARSQIEAVALPGNIFHLFNAAQGDAAGRVGSRMSTQHHRFHGANIDRRLRLRANLDHARLIYFDQSS
jgi:hypothetical protein